MAQVTIVNYGLGNINAFVTIYKNLNIDIEVATNLAQLKTAKKIILPGVGAFDWAMTRLNESGLRETLDDLVLQKEVPVLGVCVGMQIMADRSEEGNLPGLGWIEAEVVQFRPQEIDKQPLPHMGWNDIQVVSSEGLFHKIQSPRYYFLHSYHFKPHHSSHILATATYGTNFTAAIRKDHIFGTQFHPEKSHQWGVDLLHNFEIF